MRNVTKMLAVSFAMLGLPVQAASQEPLLKSLELKKGQTYASAKAQLVKKGWQADKDHRSATDGNNPPPFGFEEVVCGNGWEATCSARFLKTDRAIMLILRPEKTLVVDGVWDDS